MIDLLMCLIPTGWSEEQQARVYAVVTGVRARAALGDLRRQTAQLPWVPACVLDQQPRQVSPCYPVCGSNHFSFNLSSVGFDEDPDTSVLVSTTLSFQNAKLNLIFLSAVLLEFFRDANWKSANGSFNLDSIWIPNSGEMSIAHSLAA